MDGTPDYSTPSMKLPLSSGTRPANRKPANFAPKAQQLGARTFKRPARKPTSARPVGGSRNGR